MCCISLLDKVFLQLAATNPSGAIREDYQRVRQGNTQRGQNCSSPKKPKCPSAFSSCSQLGTNKKAEQPYHATTRLSFQAAAAAHRCSCAGSTVLTAHREGQRHVVSASHQLLAVPLDLLLLSQLLVVLHQLVNLQGRGGTDTR